jgi:hypothetical protein
MIAGYVLTTENGSIDFTSEPHELDGLAYLQDALHGRGQKYDLIAFTDTEPIPFTLTEKGISDAT